MARGVATGLRIYDAVLQALVALIAAIVLAAVVFRYVFNAPLIFSFDLATVLFAWLVFLGLARAATLRAHLAVDLVTARLPARAALAVAAGVHAVTLALALFIAWHGWDLAARTRMEISTMRVSTAWLYASAPVGFGLLALHEAVALLRLLAGRPAGEAGAPAGGRAAA